MDPDSIFRLTSPLYAAADPTEAPTSSGVIILGRVSPYLMKAYLKGGGTS